jgi:hypothetical protein
MATPLAFALNHLSDLPREGDGGEARGNRCGTVWLPDLCARVHNGDPLLLALVQSFDWDEGGWIWEWVEEVLHAQMGGVVVCSSAPTAASVRTALLARRAAVVPPTAQVAQQWVVGAPANLRDYGSMHTKLVACVYAHSLMVAVVSGNATPSDWHRKSESVWWQRFPLKATASCGAVLNPTGAAVACPRCPSARAPGHWDALARAIPPSDFEASMQRYLVALHHAGAGGGGIPHTPFLERLRLFDCRFASADLLPSVPGSHPVADPGVAVRG